MPSAVRLWNSAPGARIEIGDRGTQVIMPFLSNVSLTNQGNQLPVKQDHGLALKGSLGFEASHSIGHVSH